MCDKILNLAREDIVALRPYSSARDQMSGEGLAFNANENPFPRADDQQWQRYPMQQPSALIHRFSELYAINCEQVLVTRGSDEGIELLIRSFCQAYRDGIMQSSPTYGMYRVSAKLQGAEVVNVPLTTDCQLDITTMLKSWQPHIKLIFVCSPNNPTGNAIKSDDIVALCTRLQGKSIIVVDEAYIEFSQQPSMSRYLSSYPNLIILRTLSKAYGLAGVRCGAVLAHAEIIALLRKVLAPYPVPIPVIEAVKLGLTAEAQQKVQQEIATIIAQREQLAVFLTDLSWVECVYPSVTNFLLVRVKKVKAILNHCYAEAIFLRDLSLNPDLSDCLRISIGTPNQNKQLQEVLSRVKD